MREGYSSHFVCQSVKCVSHFFILEKAPFSGLKLTLEKWFPLQGEPADSLKLFFMYDKRFEISKKNRMEEETEPQT